MQCPLYASPTSRRQSALATAFGTCAHTKGKGAVNITCTATMQVDRSEAEALVLSSQFDTVLHCATVELCGLQH